MQDTLFGLLVLGTFSGVIPAVLAIIFFQCLGLAFKLMKASFRVLSEKEPPKKPVQRNVKEELWDEAEGDAIDQFLRKGMNS